MPIQELHVRGYRSIRDLRLRLKPINVLVGPNGCGKSNLYNALYILARSANGELARTLALEGGMPSALWAGSRKKQEQSRLCLSVTLDTFGYEVECGLPIPSPGETGRSLFGNDPLVKEERVHIKQSRGRKIIMMEHAGGFGWARNLEGNRTDFRIALSHSESALSQIREPHLYPDLAVLREEFNQWRFYHQFRTDADSPLRQPQVGVRTPVLAHDGRDLAAAIQTIFEVGDGPSVRDLFAKAISGAQIRIHCDGVRFEVMVQMPGIRRPFEARELSDGTLRFLCLLAALLSPRPPSLIALNEPETSLHPDLLDPLAELIVKASANSQIWITTHSERLAEFVTRHSGQPPIRLEQVDGETKVAGQRLVEEDV